VVSARHEACKSLTQLWTEILSALQLVANDECEKHTIRARATGIHDYLNTLEGCFIAVF